MKISRESKLTESHNRILPLQSDLTTNQTKFDAAAVSEQIKKVNAYLEQLTLNGVKWWEVSRSSNSGHPCVTANIFIQVGAPRYREMQWKGETALPAPIVIPSGKNTSIPSRDRGRNILCRYFVPEGGSPRGVFLHIHGGGWCFYNVCAGIASDPYSHV